MKQCMLLRWWSSCGLALLAVAGSSFGEPARTDGRRPGPAFLVQPYLQLPAPDGMTVMWETDRPLPGRVDFGAGETLDRTVEAKQPASLHEVRLTGLKPATTYRYRVRSGALISEVRTFHTAPPSGTRRWRMAVYGDSRSNPAVHHRVAEQIARAKVDLVVHTGDIVLNGRNRASWRVEFFTPAEKLLGSVPLVTAPGNHEHNSENYFSYMALPGNERYFGIDYANADIVCLDSNTWVARGRDSEQFRWIQSHLHAKRPATWTFVAFHHPLFSAHATRPINPLRWEWAPLLLDPGSRVDAVLTGHDHFYARNYRMGRLGDRPQPGVLFLTTAGGGASLYRLKQRDYVARELPVHHFTLFDFDGDRVTLTAIDQYGKVFDRYMLTKDPTPPEDFCAYEVEEFKQAFRKALVAAPPLPMSAGRTTLDTTLQVPTTFRVPVSGQLRWEATRGWRLRHATSDFRLRPGEAMTIPLQAEVAPGPYRRTPRLTVTFDPGQFRNRSVAVFPFKLGGPTEVRADHVQTPPRIDGKLDDPCWASAPEMSLLGLPPFGGRADGVKFLVDDHWLYVGVHLDASGSAVDVAEPAAEPGSDQSVLFNEHVRLLLDDGKEVHTFALAPSQRRYSCRGKDEDMDTGWRGVAARAPTGWQAEFAIPRKLLPDLNKVRLNLVHHARLRQGFVDYALSPDYEMGPDPDRLPDWRLGTSVQRFARFRVTDSRSR